MNYYTCGRCGGSFIPRESSMRCTERHADGSCCHFGDYPSTDPVIASLAGDMWNELENLRDLWTGTEREVFCEMLIERYEDLIA